MKVWRRLRNLPSGTLFATKDGILAVKSEYFYSNDNPQPQCILLASGEYAHFADKEQTWVSEIDIAVIEKDKAELLKVLDDLQIDANNVLSTLNGNNPEHLGNRIVALGHTITRAKTLITNTRTNQK